MSDPVTNVEIEDVLSSIRRLVSAEERSTKEPEEKPVEEADKLVLTPSQRIDEAPADEVESFDDGSAEQEATSESYVETDTQDDQDDSDWSPDEIRQEHFDGRSDSEGDSGSDHSEQTESETVDDSDSDQPDEAEWQHSNDEDSNSSDEEDWAQDAGDESTEANLRAALDDEPVLDARVAGFEEVVAATDDQWEPDGTTDEEYSGSVVSPLPWDEDAVEPDFQGDIVDVVAEEVTIEPEPESERAEKDLTPDYDQEDLSEAAESSDETSAETADEDEQWFGEDAVLDEEVLRDLVSEIVRQELQGALGERITRNVRKLVRREIHRALMSQNID